MIKEHSIIKVKCSDRGMDYMTDQNLEIEEKGLLGILLHANNTKIETVSDLVKIVDPLNTCMFLGLLDRLIKNGYCSTSTMYTFSGTNDCDQKSTESYLVDNRLSCSAKGVMSLLLHMVSDNIESIEYVLSAFTSSPKEETAAALKELKENGYIKITGYNKNTKRMKYSGACMLHTDCAIRDNTEIDNTI